MNIPVSTTPVLPPEPVYHWSSFPTASFSRKRIASSLRPFVSLAGFHVQQRTVVLRTLDLFEATKLDWGDVMIAASMERADSTVLYSYDRGFDRLPGITRKEPSTV